MKHWILAILLIAFPTVVAAQDCAPGSIDARQTGNDEYDPNELVEAVIRISLRLNDSCDLSDLQIVPRDSNVFTLASAGSTLQLIQSDAPETLVRNISQFDLTQQSITRLAQGDEIAFDLLDLEPGQFVQSGNYQTTIDLASSDGALGSLVLNVIVRPTVRLLGDAEGGNIDIDLGRLNDGVSAQKAVFFRANSQVTLLVTSDNGGRLVHERGEDFGSIPYVTRLDGNTVSTSNPVSVGIAVVPGQLSQTLFGVDVAPVQAAFGGIYRDIITLSFTAQ